MNVIFLKILNMSISASWLVLAVVLLRIVFKKAPKWVNVLMWGIVALRLICPISIESALSLIPSTETIPDKVISGPSFDVETGIEPVDDQINDFLGDNYFEGVTVPTNNGVNVMTVLSVVWMVGILILLSYTVISYWRLRRKISTSVLYRENIFQSENVTSPFVLGIIRPKIYLPFKMDSQDMEHVIAHEKAHISRKDHWWKPIGFALLTIHWFNPLIWVAYVLLCRDIELACDERVIKKLDNEQRADYTQALVACSVDRHLIAACPLAFGEVGVKDRVKAVMNYKKPAFWIIIISIFTCIVVAICFLTDPIPDREFKIRWDNIADIAVTDILDNIAEIEDLDDTSILNTDESGFDLTLTSDFELFNNDGTISFYYIEDEKINSAQLRLNTYDNRCHVTNTHESDEESDAQSFKLQHYLEAIKYLPQEEIRKLFLDADMYTLSMVAQSESRDFLNAITYSSEGIIDLDGWYIHLTISPLYKDSEGSGWYGDRGTHLFYGHGEIVEIPENKLYLTIGAENVSSIKIATHNTSGGCTNADGSPFKKGEQVWIECLDRETDLSGLKVTAYNENGEVVWSAAIPEAAEDSEFVRFRQDGWVLTNIE